MKKRIILGTICILGLSFLFHSIYKKIPLFITSLIFPVNESIWEHGKMTLLSFIVWTLIEKYIFKDDTNVIYSNLITSIICIILTDIVFGLIFFYVLKTKDNLPVTIIIYTICIIISLFLKEKFIRKEKNINREYAAIIGYIMLILIFAFLTYYPIKLPIFYDFNKKIYGIPKKLP